VCFGFAVFVFPCIYLDNPTDNSTSTYAAQTLQNLKEIGVTSTSARSDYVAIGPDGRKLTSSTGTDAWKHKDYGYHFRSVSHYIDTVFAIDIKVDFVAV
jgi:hypothetical protein